MLIPRAILVTRKPLQRALPVRSMSWVAIPGHVCATTKYCGVTACGLWAVMDFPSSVALHLRGVTLAGIDSVMCPTPDRLGHGDVWVLDPDIEKLGVISREIGS